MNTIVDKLLDVDKEARAILDNAQQYYENTVQETQEEKQRIYKQYKEKAQKHIENATKSNDMEAQEQIAAIQERYTAIADRLESACNEYREQWQEEIFQRCVTGR